MKKYRYRATCFALCHLALFSLATPVLAEESDDLIFGSGTSAESHFKAPGDLFSVAVPGTWQVRLPDANSVEFVLPDAHQSSFLTVRRIEVPEGATAKLLLLKAIEQRLSKQHPNFKIIQRREPKIAGYFAAAVVAVYDYQGNVQFPRALEEIIFVAGRYAYILHFECYRGLAAELAPELETFYTTFSPGGAAAAPAEVSDHPFAPQGAPPPPVDPIDALDKIPF